MQGSSITIRTARPSISHIRLTIVYLLTIVLSSGCGVLEKVGLVSGPAKIQDPVSVPLSEQPYDLKLILSASADLNPDTKARPSPVQVRLFLTEPQSEISTMSFENVFDFSGNVMEPRPLATVTMQPGDAKTVVLPAMKSQTLLLVAVAYRDPYQSIWSAVAHINPMDTVIASATLDAAFVTINTTP